MLQLKDDNGNELPQEVQDRVNKFIDNLPKVTWFKPSKELTREAIDKQAKFTMECFGVEAPIEYRLLRTQKDWASAWASARPSASASARPSARSSALDSAWYSALDSAWDSAWDSALAFAWASAWDSAWDSALASTRAFARASARASAEILLEGVDCDFNKKYPNGAFKQLFKLWEMGLYPAGVLKDSKTFVIYIPPCSIEFPELTCLGHNAK